MANPKFDPYSLEHLLYILNHVFLPPKLPQEDDTKQDCDIALCYLVYQASQEFTDFSSLRQQQQWSIVKKMLETLLKTTQALDKDELIQSILHLEDGEVLVLHIHAQNAALILRRLRDSMIFETFEVSATPGDVMEVGRKLICSYPGPAVELPLDVAHDPSFVEQLVSFLVHMDVDQLDAPTTIKAQSKVSETRGTAHPRYITQLLTMILHGMGKEAEVKRITKRVADDVCWHSARNPWRRSPLWLVLRVAIQTTIDSRDTYKKFMVFFQTKLLRLFLDTGLSSELLYVARVKTSRRVYKLGASASTGLLEAVETVGRKIELCLQERWSEVQLLQASAPSYTPDSSAFEKDTTISLLESRDYLTKVMDPDRYPQTSTTFNPRHIPRLYNIDDFHLLYPDGLTKAARADSYVAQLALADFEFLVQDRLDSWVTKNGGDEAACKTLGSCLEQYISIATKQYSSTPEAKSLMLLTIMELWVALDTIVVVQCGLLSSYSPEIPSSILDPLLLRRAKSIERAAQIECYLRRRHSEASCATSIYSDELDNTTFAVRYFQGSVSLQEVKASIERDANDARVEKRNELERMNRQYQLLSQQIASRACQYTSWGHFYRCSRCELQRRANAMDIEIHEWPLPTRHLEGEAIVFELSCPPVFAIWRTRTYQILRDVGMAHIQSESKPRTASLLERYEGLEARTKEGRSGRITFGSETKSFLNSHYRRVKIPADEKSVCVNNGLCFRLYDREREENAFSSFTLNLVSYCTLRLPEGSYRHLQYAVDHTTHTHNETIANQGDCPVTLSPHEQLAFSNLRCGSRLQWMNIARELRAGILTFSREEVHALITQAAWQIGPLSNDGLTREWHFELGESDFGLVLIREAMDLLSHIEANWMEVTTIKSIIYLTSRLLASTTDVQWEVRCCGYQLLRKARQVTHKWMREIVQKLSGNENQELQRRACEIAATCRATFDVDPGTHLDAPLYDPVEVAILVECAIIIHDNTPPHLGNDFPDFQKLLHRDRRLSHLLESNVSKLIQADRSVLDIAIGSVWSGYRRGDTGWTSLPCPNSQWLTSLTAPVHGQTSQAIHYNVLDGELLVDGRPLGRLPREITGHPTYRRIFNQKVLDVIPADMPGMDYVTRSPVCGYEIFFTLRDSQSLIIRAKTSQDKVLELIPHDILRADFPTLLATEHAHWMDIRSGEVEFRPLDQLWKPSSQNWRLVFSTDGPSRMTQKSRYLVDIRSGTFEGISARIGNLEYPEYLTIVYDQQQGISIDLPRFRLSFFLSNGELESKNMHGMVIDSDQSTGTMIGLRSQLVLRHKDPILANLPRSRHVLIPYGVVDFSLPPDRNHVHVVINTRTRRQVTWHKYEIDSNLGLLAGNVSLTSRLYRIYLHALCSHPLPDPLTSQTGTDHALQELRAAGCFSFQKLTETDDKLLRLIGNITPCRHYYPIHLRVMQTTEWSPDLPALSQHGAFEPAVRSILEYAQSLAIFPELSDEKVGRGYNHGGDFFLLERAMWRNAVYYEGGLDKPLGRDGRYSSRDSPHVSDHDSNGIHAMNTSRLVFTWPVGLNRYLESSELLRDFGEWGCMSGVVPGASLEYTKEWVHLDLSEKFLTIYDLCRQIEQGTSKKFKLVFSFSALVYGIPHLWRFIPVLLAFATMDTSFKYVDPPQHSSYDLADGFEPAEERVRRIIVSAQISKPLYYNNSDSDDDITLQHKIDDAVNYYLIRRWCSTPLQSPFIQSDSRWLRIEDITSEVAEYFASCSRNRDLRSFALGVTKVLQGGYLVTADVHIPRFCFSPQFNVSHTQQYSPITFTTLLSTRSAPLYSTHEFGTGIPANPRRPGQPINTSHLENLIAQFKRHHSHSDLTQRYGDCLETSRGELHGQQTSTLPDSLPPEAPSSCSAYRDQCQAHLDGVLSGIRSSLEPSTVMDRILANAGLWPRIHSRAMLNPLASASKATVTRKWDSLTDLAQAFIEYQLSQRLMTYVHRSESDNFFKELDNASFNWSDEKENSDWLLIQIQGNFITRALQSEVAKEMIEPSSGSNTVLQLNMGEGKSSVIVPLVAVALADSDKLVRIVVLEPLVGQMFHLLVERISGLTNRRIFYLPFSRDVKMGVQQIEHIRSLFEECARVQGVLVAQPKHILSFQLKAIDRMLSSGPRLDNVAQDLQKLQTWLTSTSRDVLDESDELLHVRYQLIYTMDEQRALDNGPDRWIITQNVFDLVRRHARELHDRFPDEVELLDHDMKSSEGNFSHIRLLGTSAAQELVSLIAEDVLNGRLENLTFVGLSAHDSLRKAVLCFITNVGGHTHAKVEDSYSGSSLWKGLLLLRGLLAHGILVHILSRQRWRVDYGLDPKRSLLAVPYRAKDVPSLRSDFGHPDVAVCLTCLSFYYGGLTPSQVRECFDLLFKLDNPALEYEKWVKRGGDRIPEPLRQLIGVNTKDVQTFTQHVVPVFRHNQPIIDFFLSQVVFPKEAKEFLFKLGTSGWDLAKHKANVTTGFSGTKDNSELLPLSISQSDPVNQLRMNAQVLGYLLQPENDQYICTQVEGTKGQPCSVAELLGLLVREPEEIRVLLDVGAQMLEMTNRQLVEHWLSLRQSEDVAAAVFFDDADTLSVLSLDGVVEPFYASPFSQCLDKCIIYLDDAHTRGTDLKLPHKFRAMVTLGPKVTKDRLVQGCMRMRKLGHGQSVVFCAPPDIDRRIRKAERIRESCPVKVIDILSWVMSNTCIDIERHIPHWAQQGVDYDTRQTADSAFIASEGDVKILQDAWLQPAARSLEQMYSPSINDSFTATKNIPGSMEEHLRKLGVTIVRDVRMEEEQEREVSHEVEQEQQIERPPKVAPASHYLDEKVRSFVRFGTNSDTFLPLMSPLHSEFSAIAPQNPWSRLPRILCTRDFMTTTKDGKEKSVVTDYLRPVNWIVSLTLQDGNLIFVVMSPYEVNRLLPDIRASKYVRLHMYTPRTTEAMKPLDGLAFYCIPPLPSGNELRIQFDVRCQLNIWAGQLYLDSYDTYLHLCLLLGVSSSEETGYSSVENDRFVPKRGRIKEMADVCLFDKSPMVLLKRLFGLRRKGMSYQQTHMGKILHVRLLSREDFQ